MFLAMTKGGTMMFFSCVTAIGLAWVWFFLPETSGKSLESLDAIFDLPWYLIGIFFESDVHGALLTSYLQVGKEQSLPRALVACPKCSTTEARRRSPCIPRTMPLAIRLTEYKRKCRSITFKGRRNIGANKQL